MRWLAGRHLIEPDNARWEFGRTDAPLSLLSSTDISILISVSILLQAFRHYESAALWKPKAGAEESKTQGWEEERPAVFYVNINLPNSTYKNINQSNARPPQPNTNIKAIKSDHGSRSDQKMNSVVCNVTIMLCKKPGPWSQPIQHL